MNNISEIAQLSARLDSIEAKLDRLIAASNSKVTVEDIKVTVDDTMVDRMKAALSGLNTGYPQNGSVA